jgi:lipid II:glycine glycyltransferase (peptidoglycan interpeptide bridge formation enzyme)
MTRDLPANPDRLFQEFNAKLRSQIRKPEKDGMRFLMGGETLLDDFYKVFCRNMRDLGSPVHSRDWFGAIVREYRSRIRIGVVYHAEEPAAAGVVLACRDTMSIPWASSLRKYNPSSPNMQLYWNFLKFACENGYKKFDFGRCTAGSGTHKFKVQWGCAENPIRRIKIDSNVNRSGDADPDPPPIEGSAGREVAMRMWRNIPLGITNFIGPKIRKYITL